MNIKWLLGIVASLVVLGIGSAISQTIKNESRTATIEEAIKSAKEDRVEFRREVKAELKDLQAKVDALNKNQAEQLGLLRQLTSRSVRQGGQ